MNIVGVLQEAKDILITDGWMQYEMGDAGGPKCITGAIVHTGAVIHTGESISDDERSYAFDYLVAALMIRDGVHNIPNWNDVRGRTFNEVMNLFDEAILLAKERESRS